MAPIDISAALQSDGLYPDFNYGKGGGYLYLQGESPTSWPKHRTYHAALLPFIKDYGGYIYPAAQITVFDKSGQPAQSGLHVLVDVLGEGATSESCTTDHTGRCLLWTYDAVSKDAVAAWKLTVTAIEDEPGILHRTSAAVTATQALQRFIGAVNEDADLSDALLAWSWESSHDAVIGLVSP
ncbi:MAG: hypothetical protein AAGA48_00485 [Myxococcota bacterium]